MAKATFHRGGLLAISAAVLIVTFASGYALGHGTQPSSAAAVSTCNWSVFPGFPNATALSARATGVSYRAYAASFAQVVRFYQAGAGQRAWTFVQTPTPGARVATFRVEGPNGCRGILTIQSDQAGVTIIEVNADSNDVNS